MKAETDQFFDGLDVLGVTSMVKKYPDLMKPLFVPEIVPLKKGNHYHTQSSHHCDQKCFMYKAT